ncbi:MAG: sugar ABC transporter permease [Candidatus Acetothermia bacterium]|nr:sugar ABC transporter permease [Candidatus Acetothermia bacterium]MDH7505701.1 sugar ABC transporter permease [Candidatus Acetothermia bacterium]
MRAALLALLPTALIFLVFTAFPLVYSVYLSLHDWSFFSPAREFVALENFRKILASPAGRNAFRVTGLYAISSIPLLLVTSLGLALLLQRGRGAALYRAAIFAPAALSPAVTGLIWSWAFEPHSGLINYLLRRIGLWGPNWLADPNWALPALIIATVWQYAGYYMVIFSAGLERIPASYYEAARLEGAGPIRRLFSITLPLLRKTTAFVLVIATINSFQAFGLVYVLTGGGPMDSTNLVVNYLYREAFEFFRLGYASAVGWLLALILVALALVQIRYIGRGSRLREE